jgi:hypothetical protein
VRACCASHLFGNVKMSYDFANGAVNPGVAFSTAASFSTATVGFGASYVLTDDLGV